MLDWKEIDTVLLDMDGTLLDLHFDNHFWQSSIVPRPLRRAPRPGADRGPPPPGSTARRWPTSRARSTGTVVDFWTRTLQLDIARTQAKRWHT
jgi:FMN phosphatase YigB (HAD superfamily)